MRIVQSKAFSADHWLAATQVLGLLLVILGSQSVSASQRDQQFVIEVELEYFWQVVLLYASDQADTRAPFVSSSKLPPWWAKYSKSKPPIDINVSIGREQVGHNPSRSSRNTLLVVASGEAISRAYGRHYTSVKLGSDKSIHLE